jgi:hypothetical protein
MNTKTKRPQIATPLTASKVQNLPYKKSFAVKQLEAMANDAARAKNPNTPPEWLAPRKYSDNSANNSTRCIIDFLNFSGWQAERINNTGRQIDTRQTFTDVTGRSRTIGSSKWIKGTGTNGTADISATIKGRSVKIEVKYGRDVQSEAQRAYQYHIEQSGGLYLIASSFEQFLSWYNLKFNSDEN